mgnify:CR=1 FL=1
MGKFLKHLLAFILPFFFAQVLYAQQDAPKNQKQDYQIFLTRPAKSIRLLMYEKNFVPIQGKLSEDKKSIIIKNYENGSRVHVKVEYEDGTTDEFIRSPCYIDPVIVLNKIISDSNMLRDI